MGMTRRELWQIQAKRSHAMRVRGEGVGLGVVRCAGVHMLPSHSTGCVLP
jgi:hypothetical protein